MDFNWHKIKEKSKEKLSQYPNVASGGVTDRDYEDIAILTINCRVPNMKICEVGGWTGFISTLLGSIAKSENGTLVTIDTFKDKKIY